MHLGLQQLVHADGSAILARLLSKLTAADNPGLPT